MSEPQLARISLPSWREDAVSRCIAMYDVEDADGALVKVKRGASDQERYAAVLELLEETYSEAAALLHSSKAAAKTKLAVAIGRLNEVSLDGREFAATSPTTYDWRPTSDVLEEQLRESVKQAKAKPRGENKQAPKVDDEYVKKVVKQTAPKPPAKTRQAKSRTTKAPAKPAPKTRTTSRKRTTTK
jgi:hypothetical protein